MGEKKEEKDRDSQSGGVTRTGEGPDGVSVMRHST